MDAWVPGCSDAPARAKIATSRDRLFRSPQCVMPLHNSFLAALPSSSKLLQAPPNASSNGLLLLDAALSGFWHWCQQKSVNFIPAAAFIGDASSTVSFLMTDPEMIDEIACYSSAAAPCPTLPREKTIHVSRSDGSTTLTETGFDSTWTLHQHGLECIADQT